MPVLKLKLLYSLFFFCCGSIRHHDETRMTPNEGHTMMKHVYKDGGDMESIQCGWEDHVAGCRSQETVAVEMMKLNIAIVLEDHARPFLEAYCGSARFQLHDFKYQDSTPRRQVNCQHVLVVSSVLHVLG